MNGPICPLCKIRECTYDSEPGSESYFSTCYECTTLSGYRTHSHTYYPSPAQIAAGTWPAGHSWRTSVSVRPLWTDGRHVGFRCTQFDQCGWEHLFTGKELMICPTHSPNAGTTAGIITALCFNSREHRLERGEASEPHGYLTEYGRQAERERSDADNWDPGKYLPHA